ncbi:MAG: spondin domain-containing protein [Gemmatimonadota bacterium]|nr:spondin domain-containing protein [Gemmatimonadota bacterium]
MNIKSIAGGLALASALLAACGEPVDPPVPGSIVGTVSIEGTGVDGVTVTLEGTTSTTTAGGGAYRFDNVDEGMQTVTISGFPPESDFPEISVTFTLGAGQTHVLDFNGSYVRTAAIVGSVTVDGAGIDGVSVALGGTESKSTQTDADGNYDFSALRAGDYTVTISDFDPAMYTFDEPSQAVSIAAGESSNVSFMGTPTRLPGQVDYIVRIENVSPAYEFSSSGHFAVPVGADGPGPLLPGGTYEFLFHAGPGLYLSFATMFVQSNDLFYAPDGRGIAVWGDDGPVTGDITDQIMLWDAGTEINQEPGAGADQPIRGGGNSGAADPDPNVRLATDDFGNLPEVADVIRVTLHREGASPTLVRLTIENISTATTLMTADGGAHPTPLAPGVFVVHAGHNPLFTVGEPDRGEGLEGLAEDGTVSELAAAVEERSGLISLIAPGVYATHSGGPLLFKAGEPASAGLESMAEDGHPVTLATEVDAAGGFLDAGVFAVPVGADGPAPVGPGRAYEFEVIATPGDALSFVTMFVQSNDLFYAPAAEGIDLFPNGVALEGDITDQIMLWDAGTEVNEKPGLGPYQAPRQPGPDSGPDEDGLVNLLDACFTYPDLSDVLRVTLTKVAG